MDAKVNVVDASQRLPSRATAVCHNAPLYVLVLSIFLFEKSSLPHSSVLLERSQSPSEVDESVQPDDGELELLVPTTLLPERSTSRELTTARPREW